jgi:hypothetical protein
MDDGEQGFYFCYFENSFENDIFIESNYGLDSLNKMGLTRFKFDAGVEEIRISSKNNLFLQSSR